MPNTRLTDSQLFERQANIIASELLHRVFTYSGTNKVLTMKEYPTGTATGEPCKLTTYTYDGSDNLIDMVETIGAV